MPMPPFCWALAFLLSLHLSTHSILVLSSPVPPPLTQSPPSPPTPHRTTTVFTDLLTLLNPAPGSINLAPPAPLLPNVFLPMTQYTENGHVPAPTVPKPPRVTLVASDIAHHIQDVSEGEDTQFYSDPENDNDIRLAEVCHSYRAPSLPASSVTEIGVVRVFEESSFRTEVAILKGCGCLALPSPTLIESFVGSRNHTFSFYSNDGCSGEPFLQRFKQHYNFSPAPLTRSVLITQGLLPPLPPLSPRSAPDTF